MIDIRKAEQRAEFEAVHGLISMLAAWDVAQMDDLGLPSDDVVARYYSDDVDALAAKYAGARTPFLVGRLDGKTVACGALADAGGGVAEITHMFVQPDFRGKGAAKALLAALVKEAEQHGYDRLRLATTTFMTVAVQLYRAYGFTYVAPFHTLPDGLRAITIFMERKV